MAVLWQVFIQNGCPPSEVDHVLAQQGRKASGRRKAGEIMKGGTVVPSFSLATNEVSRLLHRKKFKTVT